MKNSAAKPKTKFSRQAKNQIQLPSLLAIISGLILNSCATSKKDMLIYLEPWKGQSADLLVAKWGPPNKQYHSKTGGSVMTWENDRSYIDSVAQYNNKFEIVAYKTDSVNRSCQITWFTDTRSLLIELSIGGNYCRKDDYDLPNQNPAESK